MTPSSLSFGPISIPFLSRSPLRRRPFLLGRTTSTSTSTPTSVSPSPSYSSSPFLASAGIHSADALGHFLLTAADRLGSSLHDASRPASVALADIAHTLQRLVSALQSLSVAVFILAIALTIPSVVRIIWRWRYRCRCARSTSVSGCHPSCSHTRNDGVDGDDQV